MIPALHAAFFCCDAAGQMVNMYAERMLPPHAMTNSYEKHYRADVVAFAQAVRDSAGVLANRWSQEGFSLNVGIGVAYGYATVGAIGYEGRVD